MSQTPAAPQVSGKMFLYDAPELLNPEAHNGLGVSPVDQPFKFAAKVRALPLTVSEIAAASRFYPVVFMSAEQPLPMAVVGLIDDHNLFINEDGRWEEEAYVPGYVRRYPFGIAAETDGERFAVVIDRGYEGLKYGGDQPLFDGAEPSAFTQNAIDFTKRYEEDRQMTNRFMEELKRFNVVSGQTAQYTPQGADGQAAGEPRAFAQYFGCDENAIKNLPDQQFLEMRQINILPILYSQLLSLSNWRLLVQRRAKRFGLTEQNVFEPVAVS